MPRTTCLIIQCFILLSELPIGQEVFVSSLACSSEHWWHVSENRVRRNGSIRENLVRASCAVRRTAVTLGLHRGKFTRTHGAKRNRFCNGHPLRTCPSVNAAQGVYPASGRVCRSKRKTGKFRRCTRDCTRGVL